MQNRLGESCFERRVYSLELVVLRHDNEHPTWTKNCHAFLAASNGSSATIVVTQALRPLYFSGDLWFPLRSQCLADSATKLDGGSALSTARTYV